MRVHVWRPADGETRSEAKAYDTTSHLFAVLRRARELHEELGEGFRGTVLVSQSGLLSAELNWDVKVHGPLLITAELSK